MNQARGILLAFLLSFAVSWIAGVALWSVAVLVGWAGLVIITVGSVVVGVVGATVEYLTNERSE